MDTRVSSVRPDIVAYSTQPRPTPTTTSFRHVLASAGTSLVQQAQGLARALPGGPLVASALRGPASPNTGNGSGISAEGPGALGGTPAAGREGGGIEASLHEAQEQNLYFLRIQETVNAQNRTFSVLSNVLKAEHETVKTAISNIR
jgi:hypothetical protein